MIAARTALASVAGAVEPAKDALTADFARDGFIGPTRLFTAAECRGVIKHFRTGSHAAPADWAKGRAATDRFVYDLAAQPQLMSLLTLLIGENIVLWGASAVTGSPGRVHPWHTDIESAAPNEGFVSVWIGVKNTSRDSGLQFIPGSHRFGEPIQQILQERRLARDAATAETVVGWARERDVDAVLVQPDVADGDALVFDGRLWHGSKNTHRRGRRTALLLQYASADCPVRMPDFSEWPFRFLSAPRPPVILVRGRSGNDVNRLVTPPPPLDAQGTSMLSTLIRPISLPLAEDRTEGWKRYPMFDGSTHALDKISCHVSVLSPGISPHTPHAHDDEELLTVLDGEAELIISDPSAATSRTERLRPGSFVYYPVAQHHTIRNPGTGPVTYLMFKWLGSESGAKQPLGTEIVQFGHTNGFEASKPFATKRLLDQPTSHLRKLHSHLTVLRPGAGYEPHIDAYDVAILVLSGRVETLGQIVEPHGLIFYAAGEPHGMRNVGPEPARYLVFEFHSSGAAPPAGRREPKQHGIRKKGLLRRARAWSRRLRRR